MTSCSSCSYLAPHKLPQPCGADGRIKAMSRECPLRETSIKCSEWNGEPRRYKKPGLAAWWTRLLILFLPFLLSCRPDDDVYFRHVHQVNQVPEGDVLILVIIGLLAMVGLSFVVSKTPRTDKKE